MEIPGIKEYKNFKENTVKDVRNLFRLNKSVTKKQTMLQVKV